jgi:hypothetical protein
VQKLDASPHLDAAMVAIVEALPSLLAPGADYSSPLLSSVLGACLRVCRVVAANPAAIAALEDFCLREGLVEGLPAVAAQLLAQLYIASAEARDAAKLTQIFSLF